MKHYISKFLKTIAILHLSFPVSYIVSVAIFFDVPSRALVSILLSPIFYVCSALAMIVGYGLWEMRRWAWYLFIFTHFIVVYSNAVVVHDYSESHYKSFVFFGAVLATLILIYRVSKEIRVPYFFPKIRWWESNPRYRLSVPVKMAHEALGQIEGQILDLSTGGCFIKIRNDLKQDERIRLDFAVFGHRIECEGTVVWCTHGAVTHPRGIGVKFIPMERAQKRSMRLITRRLKKIAAFYRRSRYMLNQEEFTRKLEELESRGIKTG